MFGINTCNSMLLYVFVSSTCTVIRYKETKGASFQKTMQQLRRWSPYCPRQHLWRTVDPQIGWPQRLWALRLVLQWFLSFRLCMLKASEKYHGYFTSEYSDIQPLEVHYQTFLSVKPKHARNWPCAWLGMDLATSPVVVLVFTRAVLSLFRVKRRHPALRALTWDDFPRTIARKK